MNPRAINGTPFADVPAGYRIIAIDSLYGYTTACYRWQRVADGYTSMPYPTHQRAAAGAGADAVYQRTLTRS